MEGKISDYLLHKDGKIMVFNKPSGTPVQGGNGEVKSLLQLAEIYSKHPMGIIHRLDQPASGICILARDKKTLGQMSQALQAKQWDKTYWAVVRKGELEKEATLIHYLRRNGKTKKAEVSEEEKTGFKKAELNYRVLGEIDNYILLEIKLITGRFHQIRAQLSAMGFPIKGDVKYGAKRGNKDRSIHLLAKEVSFTHPATKERMTFTVPIPDDVIWKAFSL